MLEIRRLRLLRELHARGTIAAVAQALSYSSASVSEQLGQLEREAGVRLLERVGRGVRLTPAAVRLVDHAELILTELERAEAMLARSASEVSGVIRVAAVQTTALWLVPTALAHLITGCPELRVELTEIGPELALNELRAGEFDLVVGVDQAAAPRLVIRGVDRVRIMTDKVRLALPASHPLAAGHDPVSLADLRDAVWVAGRPGTVWNDLLLGACRGQGQFEPDVRYRSNDYAVFLNFVAQGTAVALVPQLAKPERHPGIAVRDIAEGDLLRDVFLAVRAGGFDHPSVAATVLALRRAARDFQVADLVHGEPDE